MPLLWRLFLLVAVALLPAIGIQTSNEIDLRRAREVEVQDQALGLAKLGAAEQQQTVQGIHQVLIALSELPAIKAKDALACNGYLSAIKRRYPAFLVVAATDMTGEVFCDTNGNRKPVTAAGRSYFATAVKTGAFTAGEFSVGRMTGRNVIQFALPFYGDDARMGGVLIAGLDLDWLASDIARMAIPPGAALAIADHNGTYLARYPDNDRFIGRKIPSEKYSSAGDVSTATTLDLDGVERIVGYSALKAGSGGLRVSVGLDKTLAFSDIQSRTRRGILLIMLSTSLVLVLTWLGARRFIRRPLGQLIDAANEWRLGNYARRVSIREKSEIGRVADAFDTMAGALEDRERELHEAKEKAEQAAARITTIFESTTDNVIIVDQDWRISYINERAKVRVAEGRDVVGMDLWAAFLDAEDTDIHTQLRAAMSSQRPASFEAFCPRHNVWYAMNAAPSSEGLAIYFRDITEHKHAVEARRLMEEQLHQSQKMEAVGQLTGGVAHDFNNLLAVILSNLDLLRKRTKDDGRALRLIDGAIGGAQRGATLTQRLLAFARRQDLSPRVIDVPELVAGMSDLIRRSLGPEIQITTAFPASLPAVKADPNQLELVLLNMMVNARDAMPLGGAITISARAEIVGAGGASGLKPGSYVCITVTDTGLGMDAATLARATEPFFTTKGVGKGTGLGLSTVHGFAVQSGGTLRLTSQPGVGTTAEIWLPEGTRKAQDAPAPSRQQSATVRNYTVLVVDDDELVADSTVAMLEDLGHTALDASSGERALKILAEERSIDVVITDQSMPGMTGLQLAHGIRERWPDLPIVLATGHADLPEASGLDLPCLVKPFNQRHLAEALSAVVTHDREPNTHGSASHNTGGPA
jgi:C4-dicarboxylate-specific signal transduction histidine kinase/ActR/RegA family two-component response regulator